MARNEGWTPDYVEDWLTMPRLEALGRHWQVNPPLHKMIMAFMGIKPRTPAAAAAEKPRAHTIAELKAMFPHGMMRG